MLCNFICQTKHFGFQIRGKKSVKTVPFFSHRKLEALDPDGKMNFNRKVLTFRLIACTNKTEKADITRELRSHLGQKQKSFVDRTASVHLFENPKWL